MRLRATGEEFSLVPPNSTAHNVIIGSTWVDCHGDFTVLNATSGAKTSLYFTPCGWFGSGRYEVRMVLCTLLHSLVQVMLVISAPGTAKGSRAPVTCRRWSEPCKTPMLIASNVCCYVRWC